jgi:hypothetical protein
LKDRYETTPDRLYKRKSLNLTQLVVLGWTKICQIFNTVHVLVLFFCFLRGPETWLRKPGSVHISHTGSEPCVSLVFKALHDTAPQVLKIAVEIMLYDSG